MRKHALANRLLIAVFVGILGGIFTATTKADTFHFNSGTITATVSGYETIGNTAFSLHGSSGSLAAFGSVDGSCMFCGSAYDIQAGVMPAMQLGIESATFNGSALTLWGGILISGNSFLLPDTAVGSFTAIRPVTISGQFVSPDGTFYQLAKHGRIYINFTAQDGNWSWDSAKIVLVPEPSTLMLFGTGLVMLFRFRRDIRPTEFP